MRIAVCQTPEIFGDIDTAVRLMWDFGGQADAAGADLLLLPECFLQGYMVTAEHLEGQALDLGSPGFGVILSRLARLRQMLVFGVIERAGGTFYNTAVVICGLFTIEGVVGF